jgi:hypothetical protein
MKIGIVGAGNVGATAANALVMLGLAGDAPLHRVACRWTDSKRGIPILPSATKRSCTLPAPLPGCCVS